MPPAPPFAYASLLASVSRTFYLTIRILPRAVRDPVALAYLLARASDTIADSADAAAAVRQQHLAAFAEAVGTGNRDGLPPIARELSSPHAGERELLNLLEPCVAWLESLDAADREAVRAVVRKIIHGQTLDLQRFAGGAEVIALPDGAALEEYTYLVAGCVGEFWTDLCAHHLPRYSRLPHAELRALGVDFGKGLQLVNILRDLPADLATGRCYLPADELRRAGADPAALTAASAAPVFTEWQRKAHAHLEAGRRYITAVRPARIRAGCFLPWHLGEKTLALLAQHPPLASPRRVKVPRSAVRRALLLAVLASGSDWPLRSGASA